jgi:hypothetical protein
MGIFYNLSHFVPTFCPTQGYPLRFLALIHHKWATWIMFPPKSHTNASLYMFLILQLGPLLCIIIPQHQSLIELNTSKNTIAYHDVATGAVEIKTTTHFYKPLILHDLLQMPTKNHKPVLLFLRTPLLIFVQHPPTPIAFACLKCTWPPIIVA